MEKPINFLRADKIIQLLLLIPTILTGIMGLLTMKEGEVILFYAIGLFFIGCWQIISAFILSIGYRDMTRIKYLLGVAGYFSFLLIMGQIDSPSIRPIMTSLGMVYIGIVPIFIAIWYFLLTKKESEGSTRRADERMDDILDSNDIIAF